MGRAQEDLKEQCSNHVHPVKNDDIDQFDTVTLDERLRWGAPSAAMQRAFGGCRCSPTLQVVSSCTNCCGWL